MADSACNDRIELKWRVRENENNQIASARDCFGVRHSKTSRPPFHLFDYHDPLRSNEGGPVSSIVILVTSFPSKGLANPATLLVLVVLAAAGGTSLHRSGAVQRSSPSSRTAVALLLTLGENATSAERWDGSARVFDGTLLATEGHHFSTEDAITGAGTWRCATRRDEVAPYADIHYTEMRPGARPEVLFHPVGIYLTLEPSATSRLAIETSQGNLDFLLSATSTRPIPFLGGRVSVVRVPATERITTSDFEDDEPALATLSDGSLAAAWVAYRDRGDRIFLRTQERDSWSTAEEVTTKPGDVFRCSLVDDAAGGLWVFWSQRENDRWHIWAREKRGQTWQPPVRISGEGSNTFHRATAARGGGIFLVWQSFRKGQSDIILRVFARRSWSEEMQVSESPANDWEPVLAAGPPGTAYIAWDTYDRGNYDIQFRAYQEGRLSPLRFVASSPRFEAHASVAVDLQNRPWVAWNESGVNWGKDQGFLIATPLAVPLHKERTLRVALWDGGRWKEPQGRPGDRFPPAFRENSEHPQIIFDGRGGLHILFRHWTRRNSRSIGSPLVWENYLTYLDGDTWSTPRPIPNSGGSIEKHAALTRDSSGEIWAAWMTDGRPFSTMVPQNADIYISRLGAVESASPPGTLGPLAEPFVESIPVHASEPENIQALRAYSISSGGRQYRIFRGDMHRHTDVSPDFKYDGSLIEVYRYALDAAGFDYIAPADHQTGFDQEFTWWQNQKLVDLFLIPGSFTPLFAYERSLRYPNGHRNIVFAHRGVRTFPIPPNEASGEVGAARLFEHLRLNRGISMPHSSATAQGTDWRDNDPAVEPLIEIYQGYRTSYEYEGAPRAASRLNQHAQKSGWQPEGFWWNALAKGYKLGVQASSDHWSTHISYACLLAETFTREGLLEAMHRRHAYAATDNIILDFRARSGATSYIMGDTFSAQSPPQLSVRALGTGAIKQIDLIKNQTFIYTIRPGAKQASFEFTDQAFGKGESYYYVRVLQEDGQVAWSSPIWVKN